ncbi:two-component sensor histidine kinase [Hyunsoonleella sp. SJ7]|uniref:histidine kinase n=1 Tax=Hyunsoonleella aquatilis TaxID=2762758 RepID=A0A923KKP0_9FLAO|nr:tetratricopeptide repeat-containing sensor histidine kinase [Hyunsoonleella aquatilis]MBC3757040.1 two-component sensor histidine kinase [Hyunsoonleella aquatilis]
MRIKLIHFLVVLGCCYSSAQTGSHSDKIDSIQNFIQNIPNSDSLLIAKQHYKIAELYRFSSINDSAYYYYNKAAKVFKNRKLLFETAITLFGLTVVQTNNKDYTGAEVTAFEAIDILENLPQNNNVKKYKSYIYNTLGIIFDELDLFEDAIKYLNLSLEIKKGLNGDFERSKALTINNILKVYRRSGQFDLAVQKYNEIYGNKDLIRNHPDVYVLALGNYGKTLYESGNLEQLPGIYLRALRITDSINDSYNSIILHQHLAEFYNDRNNKDSAKYYAYKAKEISEDYANDDLLKSLMLLSKIEEGETSAKFLEQYVKLSDSLQKAERAIRNKFARIRFETQQIEQENIRIARERMWLIIISVILLVAALLLYVIISQRAKNKELEFNRQQQETNEEIYNLMLAQNDKIEEARALEKKRISEELHDGVLGRLFGTRLSLDSLNLNPSVEAIKTRGQYIDELKTIEEDIRKVSHELNTDFVSGSGFVDIIETLVETQTNAYALKYDLSHDDDIHWDGVSNKYKIHVYRMLQEALHNIYKHAEATKVDVIFKLKNDVICLIIKDDGSGFEVNKAKSGIGLKNMNSRIGEVEGNLHIESEKEKGTTVTIEIPTKIEVK